jgi:hypothetical protein
VHANAEADAAIRCESGVRFAQCSLRIHSALHGLYGTAKLRKDTVARRVRYAAPVFSNDPVEYRASFGQSFERADFVSAHEAAVAFDICCEDCDEAAADSDRV